MKLKIMLADSDPENINNFRNYIRLSFPNLKIVASLDKPANFRVHVKEFEPDLILADIRFFGALSSQIIREVNEFFPNVRFIIYGTYNDSEYMQKVMEFGVIDYIYRPVKTTDLNRSIKHAEKVFSSIENKKAALENLNMEYTKNITIFEDKFLNNLINGNLSSPFEIEASFRYFKIPLSAEYTVMSVKIDHFKKIILALDELNKHLFIFKIITIIHSKLSQINNGAVFLKNLNEIVIIVGSSMELDEVISLGEELKNEINEKTNQTVTIGVGRTYKDPTDIFISYNEAQAALRYRSYIGHNTVIPIHYVEPTNNITYRYPLIKEEILVYSAVIGEYEYCENLLSQIIDALKISGDLPKHLLSKIVMNIVISINRYASEQNILIGNEFTEFFPTKEILAIDSLDQAYDYLSICLKKFCGHVLSIRDENKTEIVRIAKEYIDKNYASSITIADIALHSNTAPEFLLNSFYEVEDITINYYVNLLRMDKAKELIKINKNDDMIAQQVGYASTNLFKSAFRNFEGMPLYEYRRIYNF